MAAGIARLSRWATATAVAVVIVFGLFSLIEKLIAVSPQSAGLSQPPVVHDVHVAKQPLPEHEPQIQLPPMPRLAAAKSLPRPDAAPAPAAVPTLPPLQAPPPAAPKLDVAASGIPVAMSVGANLFGSGAFAGFAGSGQGRGGSASGGHGNDHGLAAARRAGKTLIPLSTARPEITKWAYEHKIQGWVTVLFTVGKNGHVTHVRVVDAHPKGVFEAAAVNSIAHWIYAPRSHPVEVEQRVEFRLKDYKYNWNTG